MTRPRPSQPEWWLTGNEARYASGEMVELGDIAVRRYTLVIVDDDDAPYTARAWVEMTATGPRLADLRIVPRDGAEVTARSLRAFKLQAVLDTVTQNLQPSYRRGEAWVLNRHTADRDRRAFRRAMAQQQEGSRRWLLTDEHLAKVAEVYRAALSSGHNPTQAVQEHWRLPKRGQAQRWVSRARDTGHLGPAPGKRTKGETEQ